MILSKLFLSFVLDFEKLKQSPCFFIQTLNLLLFVSFGSSLNTAVI